MGEYALNNNGMMVCGMFHSKTFQSNQCMEWMISMIDWMGLVIDCGLNGCMIDASIGWVIIMVIVIGYGAWSLLHDIVVALS